MPPRWLLELLLLLPLTPLLCEAPLVGLLMLLELVLRPPLNVPLLRPPLYELLLRFPLNVPLLRLVVPSLLRGIVVVLRFPLNVPLLRSLRNVPLWRLFLKSWLCVPAVTRVELCTRLPLKSPRFQPSRMPK